jgi:hypothetical protein
MAGVLGSVLDRGLFASPSDLAAGEEAGGVPYTGGHSAIREAIEPHTGPDTERVTGMGPAGAEHRDPLRTGAEPTSITVRRTSTGIFKRHSYKTDRGPMWHRVNATMSIRTVMAMCSGVRTTVIGRNGKTANGHPHKGQAHRIEHKRRDSPQRRQALVRRWNDNTSPVKKERHGRVNFKAYKNQAEHAYASDNLSYNLIILNSIYTSLESSTSGALHLTIHSHSE